MGMVVGGEAVSAFFIVCWPETDFLKHCAVMITYFSLRPYIAVPKNDEASRAGGIYASIGVDMTMNIFDFHKIIYDALVDAVGYYTKTVSNGTHVVGNRVCRGIGLPVKYWSRKSLNTYTNCIPLYKSNLNSFEPVRFIKGRKDEICCGSMLRCWNPCFDKKEKSKHEHKRQVKNVLDKKKFSKKKKKKKKKKK